MANMTQHQFARCSLIPVIALFPVSVLAGCVGELSHGTGGEASSALAIVSPENGQALRSGQVRVRGTVSIGNVAEVLVNDQIATVIDGEFTVDLTLAEGPARIEAVADTVRTSVDVFVDSVAPIVEITSPTPGSFVGGTQLRVEGRVIEDNLASVEVDGQAIEVAADGSFSFTHATSPGAYRLRVAATDVSGHQAYAHTSAVVGRFAPTGTFLTNGAALGIGSRAIDVIEDGAAQLIAAQDLETELLRHNPVMSDWWGQLRTKSESHAGAEVSLVPGNGVLSAEAALTNLVVEFELATSLGNVPGTLRASRAVLEAPVRIGAADGRPTARIESSDVRLEGFSVTVQYIPSVITDFDAIRDAVRGYVEDAVRNEVAGLLPDFLENALAGLQQSTAMDAVGLNIDIDINVAAIDVNTSGLRALGAVSAKARQPAVLESPGSVMLDLGGTATPTDDELEVVIGVDAANAVVHAFWEAGGYSSRLEGIAFGDGQLQVSHLSLLVPDLAGLAPADAPVHLIMDTRLPPVIVPEEGPDRDAVVVAPEISVEAVAVVDGRDVHLFTLSIGMLAPIRMVISEDLVHTERGEIEFIADPIDVPGRAPMGPELDALINSALDPIKDDLLKLDGLPIPSLVGFQLMAPVTRMDGGYMRFSGGVRYAP